LFSLFHQNCHGHMEIVLIKISWKTIFSNRPDHFFFLGGGEVQLVSLNGSFSVHCLSIPQYTPNWGNRFQETHCNKAMIFSKKHISLFVMVNFFSQQSQNIQNIMIYLILIFLKCSLIMHWFGTKDFLSNY